MQTVAVFLGNSRINEFFMGLYLLWLHRISQCREKKLFVFFVVCGVSGLARFNVTREELADTTGKFKHFEGTPIPTSVLIVLVLAVLYGLDRVGPSLPFGSVALGPWTLDPLVLIYAVSGSAMVSRIRIPKL
jgi:CDP-diacylglycerol--serine O-phosphatidyltransferase